MYFTYQRKKEKGIFKKYGLSEDDLQKFKSICDKK